MMYYLFIKKQKDIEAYKKDFIRVKENINKGKTPVFCEMRACKIQMFESIPYNIINGIFLILGTLLLSKLHINEMLSIAIVLVVNSICGATANFLFCVVKHGFRIKLCNRIGIEPTEENIAVMELLEYQSV